MPQESSWLGLKSLAAGRRTAAAPPQPNGDVGTTTPDCNERGEAIVAAGALQRFASSALLRSVAVASHRRGTGLGRILVEDLERIGRAARIKQLILLTETAKPFFERQGYRVIERDEVPQDVQGSEEFRSLCPASATCMAKTLAGAS